MNRHIGTVIILVLSAFRGMAFATTPSKVQCSFVTESVRCLCADLKVTCQWPGSSIEGWVFSRDKGINIISGDIESKGKLSLSPSITPVFKDQLGSESQMGLSRSKVDPNLLVSFDKKSSQANTCHYVIPVEESSLDAALGEAFAMAEPQSEGITGQRVDVKSLACSRKDGRNYRGFPSGVGICLGRVRCAGQKQPKVVACPLSGPNHCPPANECIHLPQEIASQFKVSAPKSGTDWKSAGFSSQPLVINTRGKVFYAGAFEVDGIRYFGYTGVFGKYPTPEEIASDACIVGEARTIRSYPKK